MTTGEDASNRCTGRGTGSGMYKFDTGDSKNPHGRSRAQLATGDPP